MCVNLNKNNLSHVHVYLHFFLATNNTVGHLFVVKISAKDGKLKVDVKII